MRSRSRQYSEHTYIILLYERTLQEEDMEEVDEDEEEMRG